MLANNTLHRAYNSIAGQLAAVPFFHGVRHTRDHVVRRGFRRVLLLGTKFTMEDGFFAEPIEAAGVAVVIPDALERDLIQAIQPRLAKGEMESSFRTDLATALARH